MRCSSWLATPRCGPRWAAAGTRRPGSHWAGRPTPRPSWPSSKPGRRGHNRWPDACYCCVSPRGEGIGVLAGISRAPLVRRLRELTARHPQFALALAVGAVLRLVAMLGYPGALWFAGDSYVYVGAALRLRPDLSKTTGYSLFLRALEPFHSLTLVAGVQHLMGLGVAVIIYALAVRCRVPKLWATVATLPVLLDGFVIEDEHMVMAEALFTFLIMLSMLLILWRTRVPWRVALLAGLVAGYAVDVRSEGLPVLVMFPVALLVRGLRVNGAWRWRNWRAWLAAV